MTLRYRAGWLIPNQVMALTHFVPDVSMDDFMGIASDTTQAMKGVSNDFHVLIDNRIINNTQLTPLQTMLDSAPYMNHPHLRHVVVITPTALDQPADTIPPETVNQITLTHVDTLDDAYTHLRAVDATINWDALDSTFFDPD